MGRSKSFVFGTLGLLLLAVGFARSVKLYSETGMVDFRNRVVAARQAERGLNPYTFKWEPRYPETLLDPTDEVDTKYTRMTSPPTTLLVHSFFADAPYAKQKFVNFALNWLCLIAIAAWLFRSLRLPIGAVLFATGAYGVSALWLFHVERGQQYVYFSLFATLAVLPPTTEGFRAFFQAIASFFRPTLGTAVFASFRERRPVRTLVVTAAIGGLLLVPVLWKYPLAWWGDYFASTRDWFDHGRGFPMKITRSIVVTIPDLPEGDPFLAKAWSFGAFGSLPYHFAEKAGWPLPYAVGLFLTAAATAGSAWKLWRARAESAISFAGRFFSAIYLTDYVLPAPRSGYNAVLFFPMIVIAFAEVASLGRPAPGRKLGSRAAAMFLVVVGLAVALEAIVKPYSSPMLVEALYVIGASVVLFRKNEGETPALRSS